MTDVLTQEQRKRCMSRIRSKNTLPEMKVRRLLHGLGYRFRLHYGKLPGKPDIVLPRLKKIVLVHGCFWHMHDCKQGKVKPETNSDFWAKKRESNVKRDSQVRQQLTSLGWDIMVIWECWTKDELQLSKKLLTFLNSC